MGLHPGSRRPDAGAAQTGSVLLYVVWLVVLLSLFATGIGARALFSINLVDRLFEQLRATYALRAAVVLAGGVIARDATPGVDGFSEEWSDNPAAFSHRSVASGTISLLAGRRADGEERFGLEDEDRRVNLNTAPEDVLQRLIESVGGLTPREAAERSQAIADWRDPDDREHPWGAEGSYYRSLRHPYDCKNAPFENVEELLLVKGVSPTLYRALEPSVTVYGSGHVNLNTASEPVLRALGLSEAGVQGLVAYRAGEDGVEGTSDDHQLPSLTQLDAELGKLVPAEDLARLKKLSAAGILSTFSTAFRTVIEARADHEWSRMTALCVLDRRGGIRLWAER